MRVTQGIAACSVDGLGLSACTLADEYSGDEPEGRQAN
jgi:hypothetical protein